jgi:hypothetical protein
MTSLQKQYKYLMINALECLKHAPNWTNMCLNIIICLIYVLIHSICICVAYEGIFNAMWLLLMIIVLYAYFLKLKCNQRFWGNKSCWNACLGGKKIALQNSFLNCGQN